MDSVASRVRRWIVESIREARGRIVGPDMSMPISRTALFSLAFAGYVAILFAATARNPKSFAVVRALGAQNGGSYGCETVGNWMAFSLAIFAVVTAWCWLLRSRDWLFEFGLPGVKLRSVGLVVIYVSFGYGAGLDDSILLTYVCLQALLLGFVYETYSRPLLPESIVSNEDLRELHLDTWKWVASITLAILALFATAIVQFYPSGNGDLGETIKMASLTVVALASILLYVHWKVTAPFRTRRLTDR